RGRGAARRFGEVQGHEAPGPGRPQSGDRGGDSDPRQDGREVHGRQGAQGPHQEIGPAPPAKSTARPGPSLAAGVRIMAPLPEVAMNGVGAEIRGLCQEIYLQDLVLSLYGVYAPRLRDPEGKRLIESYLQAEIHRQKRLERYLAARGASLSPAIRALFVAAGSAYGRLTSHLGTRVMLRMTLSSSRRAARRA